MSTKRFRKKDFVVLIVGKVQVARRWWLAPERRWQLVSWSNSRFPRHTGRFSTPRS